MVEAKKNPWIAGILNFLFLGAGYLYIGKRVGFGIGLLIVVFISLIEFSAGMVSDCWVSDLVLSLVLAYDGYNLAKE